MHILGCSHSFWAEFYAAVLLYPDVVVFGEITLGAAKLRSYEGYMDGVLDFVLVEVCNALCTIVQVYFQFFLVFLGHTGIA